MRLRTPCGSCSNIRLFSEGGCKYHQAGLLTRRGNTPSRRRQWFLVLHRPAYPGDIQQRELLPMLAAFPFGPLREPDWVKLG